MSGITDICAADDLMFTARELILAAENSCSDVERIINIDRALALLTKARGLAIRAQGRGIRG